MSEPDSEDQSHTMFISGFDRIIQQFEKYTRTSSIITISDDKGAFEEWDAARNGDEIVYGTESDQNKHFRQHLMDFIMGAGDVSIVLRSFTDVKDKDTGYFFKELRGYYVTHRIYRGKPRIILNRLNAEEMFDASNTDYRTGSLMEPEESVIYCDDDHCIDSDRKPVMIVGFMGNGRGNIK